MTGIYDFSKDLGQLRLNYQSYDEKLKKELEQKEELTPKTVSKIEPKGIDQTYGKNFEAGKMELPDKIENIFGSETSNVETDTSKFGQIGGKGEGLEGNEMGVAQFGLEVGNALTNVAGSESESWGQAASLTMKGVTEGAKIGGPVGAAVGGIVGAGVGIYDLIADSGKRDKLQREKYNKDLKIKETKRQQEQRIKDGEESLSKLQKLRKNQLNYLDLNY